MADSHSGTNIAESSQENGKESADDSAREADSQDSTESINTGGKGRHGDKIHASKGDFDDKKIFVGGLSYGTNEEKLRNHFGKWGLVVDVEVKRGYDKRSRGFGFVLFQEAEDCAKALAAGKHELDQKTIDPKMAVAVTKPKKLFVGGISHEVSVDDIKEYFSKFGTVTDSEIPVSKEEGKHKGFAFLLFEKSESVTNIVKDTYHYIKGKYRCEVKRAVSRDEHNQRILYGTTGYYSQYPGGYGYQQFGTTGTSTGRGRFRGRGGASHSYHDSSGYMAATYPGYSYSSSFGGGAGGGYDYSGSYSSPSSSGFYGPNYDYYGTTQYGGGQGFNGVNYNSYNGSSGPGYSSYGGQSYVKNSY